MPDDLLFQSQALIADKILIRREDYESKEPDYLVPAVIDFVNWCFYTAYLVPGEFRREALLSYHVDLYCEEVNNGGHSQFLYNTRIPDSTLRNIDEGLLAMGELQFRETFNEFLVAVRSEPDLLQTYLTTPTNKLHLIKTPATIAMRELDDRFYNLDGSAEGRHRLIKANAGWIRKLPCLAILTDAELLDAREAISSRNARFEARKARLLELKAEAEAKNPTVVFAKALCAKANLEYVALTAGQYTKDTDVMIWGVRVSNGIRFVQIGPTQAALFMTMQDVSRSPPLAVVGKADLPD